MVLEFDCEVALLQTAFQEIQRQHGDLTSCDLSVVLKALPIFSEAITDIDQNRREDNVSFEVIADRDRKLVAGVFYTVLKLKFGLTSSQSEFFEALDDVYPSFDWSLLLGLIAVGRWHDHLLECFEAIHPAAFAYIVQEILPLIADTKQTYHVPILVRILSSFMCPTKAQELLELSNKTVKVSNGKVIVPPSYGDLINKIFDLIVKHLLVQQSWAGAVCYDFLLALFRRLCQLLRNSFKVASVNFGDTCITSETCNMPVNSDISTVHADVFKPGACSTEKLQSGNMMVPAVHLQARYTELCYETLTSLNWKEFLKMRPHLKLLSANHRRHRMTELKSCFMELHGICRVLFHQTCQDSTELLCTLKLIYQQLDPHCQFFDELGHPTENIVNIIDERDTNYNDCLTQILTHPGLQDNKEWLNCLLRNAELLDRNKVHYVLNKLKNENCNLVASEQLKQVILKAFTSWPALVQQEFHLEYLQKQSSSDILKMNRFSKDLTITFNKIVHAEVEDQALIIQIASLCLQSGHEVLLQAVIQAIKSSVQISLAVQVLSSVSYVCQHRRSVHGPSVLGDVLKEAITNYCQTEVHTQNVKELISRLLETSVITCLEVINSTVLPFLDKWAPHEESGKLLLALELLQMVLEFEQTRKLETCITKLQPCALLMYLGNIIFQCKVICSEPNMLWVAVKTLALGIIKLLIRSILQNPRSISKKEVVWLHSKLQEVDETVSFYFIDLFEFNNVELDFKNSLYPLELLLEFACCTSNNTKALEPWLTQLITTLKHGTEAQLVTALCKVLPSCLPEEWNNLVSIIEFILSCENSPPIVTTVSSLLPSEAKRILGTVQLLCQAITFCHAAGKDTRHMMHCLNLVIQEKLKDYESGMPMLMAELSVEVCQLLRRLPQQSSQEGGVLIMALSQACLKSAAQPNKTALKLIFAGINSLPSSDLRQNLFKTLMLFSS